MIFSLITTVILVAFSFLGITTHESNKDTLSIPNLYEPLILERFFDLDTDGESERITVFSTLGKEIGNENTKIHINTSKESDLVLRGYFDGIDVHTIDAQNLQVLEVRTASGHSIDTTFYTYINGQLNLVPVSTSKPPSFDGIVSRNRTELIDIDNDGTLELFAYYRNFPPKKQRTVEVYTYSEQKFIKAQEYEETMPEVYL